jgi:hypothetical protein
MIIKTKLAAVVFTATCIITLAFTSSVQAQTPLAITLCQAELARLYQKIGRCSDDVCRHRVQVALAAHYGRCQ